MKIDLQANYILVLGETLVSWGEAVFNECRSKEIPQAFFNGCRNNVLDYFRTDEEFEGARLTGRFTYEYDEDGLSIREVYDDLFSIGEAIGAVTVSGQQIITLVQELRKGMGESEFDDSSFVLGMIYPEVFTQEQQKNGFFFHATDDKAQISVCAILTNCDFQKIGTSYGLVILSLFPETEIQNMNLFPSGALTMLSEGDRGSLDSLGKDIIALEKFCCEKLNSTKKKQTDKTNHTKRRDKKVPTFKPRKEDKEILNLMKTFALEILSSEKPRLFTKNQDKHYDRKANESYTEDYTIREKEEEYLFRLGLTLEGEFWIRSLHVSNSPYWILKKEQLELSYKDYFKILEQTDKKKGV